MLDEKLEKLCELIDDIKHTKMITSIIAEGRLVIEHKDVQHLDVTDYKSEFLFDINERLNDRIDNKYSEIRQIISEGDA